MSFPAGKPLVSNAKGSRFSLLALAIAVLGFGGCSQRPQEVAVSSHGSEYFPASVYGPASRRVIADGQPVPRGGGQYLVGKPYTIAGRTYYPTESRRTQVGNASWYGDAFHGRLTANGEIYDRNAFSAASPVMPLPSYARVTNLRNNYSMIVRVNDRGPYASDRIMDVSRRVAEALDFKRYGTAKLKVEYVGRASLAGSDDARLYATLRTNEPAIGQVQPTLVAEAAPPRARVASLTPMVPRLREESYEPVHRAMRMADASEPRPRAAQRMEARESRRYERAVAVPPRIVRDEPRLSRQVAQRRERDRDTTTIVARTSSSVYRATREARETERSSTRVARGPDARFILPPMRPTDASQMRGRHEPVKLRLARSRDD